MSRFVLVLWLFCVPCVGFSEPVKVRSGLHDTFTRIVFAGSNTQGWTVDTAENSFVVSKQGLTSGFDESGFFERIDQSRISSIKTGDSSAEFVLTCRCTVRAFSMEPQLFVVDVIDEDESQGVLPITIVEEPSPANVSAPANIDLFGTLIDVQETTESEPKAAFKPSDQIEPAIAPQLPATALAAPNGNSDLAEVYNFDLPIPVVGHFTSQLSNAIGKAATKGVLTSTASPEVNIDQTASRNSITRIDLPGLRVLPANHSSFRDATDTNTEPALLDIQPVTCPDPNHFNVAAWGDEDSFDEQVAAARRNLFREFDEPSETDIVALARSYIFFGFGAEAIALLNETDPRSSEAEHLTSLAKVVDGIALNSSESLQNLIECEGRVGLWAYLANPDVDVRDLDIDSILLSFGELPKLLRLQLQERFLANPEFAADERAVSIVKKQLQRTTGLEDGQPELADKQFEESTEDDALRSLMTYMSNRIDDRLPISEELITLIESYLDQNREQPDFQRVFEIFALGSVMQGDSVGAYDNYVANSEQLEERPRILSEIALLAGEVDDDTTFLRFSFAMKSDDIKRLSEDAKTLFSDRLASLGYDSEAMAFNGLEKPEPTSQSGSTVSDSRSVAQAMPEEIETEEYFSELHAAKSKAQTASELMEEVMTALQTSP